VNTITAIEIAERHGLDAKRLRQALRDENFAWHPIKNARWIAERGSAEEDDMIRIARRLSPRP